MSVQFSTWKTKHMNWFWTCTRKNPQRWYTIQLLPFLNIRHWRDMKEFTPVKKHSFAPSGTSNVQYQAIWRDMKEPTLVINHSAALRVTKNVQHQALWRDLKGTTAVIQYNNINPFKETRKNPHWWWTIQLLPVTKNVQHQAIWRHMKEPTLEVIHSAALNVTTNAQHQVFESMDEPTLVIFWEFFVIACGTFGKNIFKWLNNICRQHIASNSKQQQLAPKRKRFRKESIWSACQAVDCQVRETYLTNEISVFLHDFSDQNVILCG